MKLRANQLLESELRKRGIAYWIDPDSERYCFMKADSVTVFLSLSNFERVQSDEDLVKRIHRLVENALTTENHPTWDEVKDSVFWCLEPADYVDRPELSANLSAFCIRCLVTDDKVRG